MTNSIFKIDKNKSFIKEKSRHKFLNLLTLWLNYRLYINWKNWLLLRRLNLLLNLIIKNRMNLSLFNNLKLKTFRISLIKLEL